VKENPPKHLIRRDLRLTVDNPEDLIVCRAVYNKFKDLAPLIPINEVVGFLDNNPNLIELTAPFTQSGYALMYRLGFEKSIK
jgi:spore coat polysaccharide biosynthesis protein SpsF